MIEIITSFVIMALGLSWFLGVGYVYIFFTDTPHDSVIDPFLLGVVINGVLGILFFFSYYIGLEVLHFLGVI